MTDKAYRVWVQTLPSCISGQYSEWVHAEGRNLACHVRRAGKSGTAYKAEYSCVPMTREEHDYQHQHGEAACLRRFLGGEWTVETAKAWFDEQVVRYREEWKEAGEIVRI
ncbi:hypothetical protein [Zavarzinella formosa]|uniref:hypothetical protein n=1 Tax=Zavarzinella formosa TaxID=360055 RepID=UPI00030F2E91|nr:hypothetical protein [Zavarzinella formosa]